MDVILFDDEPLALDYLENLIAGMNNWKVCKKYLDPFIENKEKSINCADAIFLDISMPQVNGIELAKKIREINPQIPIVFITAYDNFALEAFEVNAIDYLLKPVQLERLQKTMNRLENYIYQQQEHHQSSTHKQDDLWVYVSGTFQLQRPHQQPEFISWRTLKCQELFLYLLHFHDKVISKSEIVETLWHDLHPEKAFSLLYVTVYQIRKVLRPFSDYMSIRNIQGGYQLKLRNVKIDIKEWENNIRQAPEVSSQTLAQHEEIMERYQGPFLQGFDYLWAEPYRYRCEKLWINQAYQIANCLFERKEYEQAALWYTQICDKQPEDETVNFVLIRIYAFLGYGLLVDYQFSKLKENLFDLNIPMKEDIELWYQQWKNNPHSMQNTF
ncbi:response regulator receiver and SARP domain-containing protein [Gracilibacillus halophilus YIM-C55.5]|uniref:Response regulator receiver and SARP domain-containing protein n=1 Tax=Gracilibacillus halophilus YIM-C55.5 TaxID=1308866 RepID=N4W9N7_9BACI|nr:response regulator [Gracilibacillus halophilus]ENH95979.1 response regulator receiver and SARP domain-containing protein [Gracilibacillus halophilus YIM-C55.5]